MDRVGEKEYNVYYLSTLISGTRLGALAFKLTDEYALSQ